MRLWPVSFLPHLPRQQLLGQHRECCALRGLGWGKRHSVVNYVFDHPYYWLYWYHVKVMKEMTWRGYNIDDKWLNPNWRGTRIGFDHSVFVDGGMPPLPRIYPEHDDIYTYECLSNLGLKGIAINLHEPAKYR